jgi:hypothetical protein
VVNSILRINTKDYEKVGPNNGLPEVPKSKHTGASRMGAKRIVTIKEIKSKKSSDDSLPVGIDGAEEGEGVDKKKPNLKSISNTIIKLSELNHTSMSRVTRFRKQLNLASSAVHANGDDPACAVPAPSINAVHVNAHITKRDSKTSKHEAKGPAAAKVDSGAATEQLRNMMEGIISGNRKLHYLDENSALKRYSALSSRDIDVRHKRCVNFFLLS